MQCKALLTELSNTGDSYSLKYTSDSSQILPNNRLFYLFTFLLLTVLACVFLYYRHCC